MKKGKSYIWIIWVLLGLLLLANVAMIVHFSINNKKLAYEANFMAIDRTNFPDDNFRQYIEEYCDADGDGRLSKAEIEAVEVISVKNMGISDLSGIEFFTNLTDLDCSDNHIGWIILSGNPDLAYLDCSNNEMDALYVGDNSLLQTLMCAGNQITCLDLSRNTELELISATQMIPTYARLNSQGEMRISLSGILPSMEKLILDSQIGNYKRGTIILTNPLKRGDVFRYEYVTDFQDFKMEVQIEITEIYDVGDLE